MHNSLRSFLFLNFLFLMTSLYCLSEESELKRFDAGFGYGPSYGLWGLNLSYHPIDKLVIYAGGGFDKQFDKSYWSSGIRYYILNSQYTFRPRLSIYYGINSLLEYTRVAENGMILGKTKEYDEGISAGAGFRWMFSFQNSMGIDFDIYYALTINETPSVSSDWNKLMKPEIIQNLFFSLGLRYEFDL